MPILNADVFEFISRSPDQTRRIGMRLGDLLQPSDVICLNGNLGAGKTTLVQGIASGWGSTDSATSPTFVLVNTYRRADGAVLNHLDAYRLQDALEAEALDLDNLVEAGPLVVEWPERILAALPADNLWIVMDWVADEHRRMLFTPHGEAYARKLEQFKASTVKGFE